MLAVSALIAYARALRIVSYQTIVPLWPIGSVFSLASTCDIDILATGTDNGSFNIQGIPMQSKTNSRFSSFALYKNSFTVGFIKGPNEGIGNTL